MAGLGNNNGNKHLLCIRHRLQEVHLLLTYLHLVTPLIPTFHRDRRSHQEAEQPNDKVVCLIRVNIVIHSMDIDLRNVKYCLIHLLFSSLSTPPFLSNVTPQKVA